MIQVHVLAVLTTVVALHAVTSTASSPRNHGTNYEQQQQQRQRQQQQNRRLINADIKKYAQMTLAEIYEQMDDLASTYPDFVTVKSTQDEFGLPSSCKDFEIQHVGCTNRYMVIEDPIIYSANASKVKTALKQRPDVFLSGSLHGDERVGPVAMLELAKLLVLAATCESSAGAGAGAGADTDGGMSNQCDGFYNKYTKEQAAWLARLVSTRRTVIFPAPNSKGYHTNSRYETYANVEGGWYTNLDPNRDFSFDNSSSQCMRSIAARSINELFLKYLFQMSMTYHAGIENITFEWGALSIPQGKVSPDDYAQRIMAEKMSHFAGELYSSSTIDQFYEHGDMNSILYGVHGGFEDWVYASSWKTDMTVQCNPNTYGGYDASKTAYDDASLNTFNILVEISRIKNPPSTQYGSESNLLNAPFEYDNHINNGYVTKHIRTALMAIDAVEPYVEIISIKNKVFRRDMTPLKRLNKQWKKKRCSIKSGRGGKVSWTVGGSFHVDETFLIYGLWSDFPSNFNSISQVSHADFVAILGDTSSGGKFTKTKVQSGNTIWSDPMSSSKAKFENWVKVPSELSRGDKLAIFAIAKVDQVWVDQPNNAWPVNTAVQSHMVNIRTNPNYSKSKGEFREVQGRMYWISMPLTIKVR